MIPNWHYFAFWGVILLLAIIFGVGVWNRLDTIIELMRGN